MGRATGFEEAVEVETEEEEAFVSPLTGTTEVLRFMMDGKLVAGMGKNRSETARSQRKTRKWVYRLRSEQEESIGEA